MCLAIYSASREENLRIHIQELKRVAVVLGGNLLLLTNIVNEVYSNDRVGAASMSAIVVLDRTMPVDAADRK